PEVGGYETGDAGDEAGAEPGAVDLRPNITGRTYVVVKGDGMQAIAKKFGAASRPHWFAELRDANPGKAMATDKAGKQLAWKSLTPGDITTTPAVWPASPAARTPPQSVPTQGANLGINAFPKLPGGVTPSPTAPPGTVPAAATVDPGTMGRLQ